MKIPEWLRLRNDERSAVTKSEILKDVRRQTDQKLKHQDARKAEQETAEKKN